MDNPDGALQQDATIDACNVNPEPENAIDTEVRRVTTSQSSKHSSTVEERPFTSEETPLLHSENGSTAEEIPSLPWWRTPSMYWILPVFMLGTLAFGGVIVPSLNLILELICRNYLADQAALDPNFSAVPVIFGGDNLQCRGGDVGKAVQARVAQFTLGASVITGLLSAIASPKMGAMSDRYGRNKMIAICSTGALAKEIIMIFAARSPETFPIRLIFVGYAIDGMAGSFTALMAIVHSYAADTTTPSNRNSTFGYFHSCLFIGIAVGPLLAGYIIKESGSILPIFYIAFAFHLVFIISFLFIIPESLSKARQRAARERHRSEAVSSDWKRTMQSLNILEPLKILYPTGPGSSAALRRNLVLLSAIDSIVFAVAMGTVTVIVIYVNYEFGWSSVETSFFTSFVNSSRVLCLLIILPLVNYFFRQRSRRQSLHDPDLHRGADLIDLNVIRFAVFFDTLGYLGYTLSRSGALFTLSGMLASAGGIGSPTLQSVLTKHIPADRTGQVLGANGLLHALGRVVGPTVFNGIYSLTVGKYTQTVFVCLTATFGVAFVCTWFVRPHVYLDGSELPNEGNEQDDDTAISGRPTAAHSYRD